MAEEKNTPPKKPQGAAKASSPVGQAGEAKPIYGEQVDHDRSAPKAEGINNEQEWNAARESWAKEQAGKAHAHALSLFDTDDDLPLSKHFLLLAICSFVTIFIIWANLATLDEVTRGEGKVVPSSDIQAMQSLDAGIVEEIMVREGDIVEADQPLMRLNAIEATSDLGANQVRYLGLLASITRLSAEAEGKTTVDFPEEVLKGAPQSVTEELNAFRANQQSLQGQLNVLEQQLLQRQQEEREVNQRVSDTRSLIGLQQQEADVIRPLVAKGSAPKLELLQLERTIKERRSELNSQLSSLPRIRSSIEEARARIEETKRNAQAQAQSEMAARLVEINEIKERLTALEERKGRTMLRSPVNGTIQEIATNTIGGVVRPGEDIIKIVPKDDQLIIEAKVRPSDRAFIFPGQKAIIKLTAYDFSIYGGLDGKLVDISADTIEEQDGSSYYRVKLRTDQTELVRKGEVLPITTGMVASVDILTGKKTVMQYLLKPFIKTIDNAMNER